MTTWSSALIPDDEDFVDDSYTESELADMDGRELQSLAAAHSTDEVNGKSTAEAIREALEGKERVEVDG
jgi:hypothetical protein